jgi:hypothetical protein
MLNHEQVKELFDYQNGNLVWKKQLSPRGKVGSIAGYKQKSGYILVGVLGCQLLAHRLVWLFFNKECPVSIDHIDGDKSNNKIENLRPCTAIQNGYNRKISANNKSGFKNVVWHKRDKLWQASITANKKLIHIGLFKEAEEAAKAVESYRKNLHKEFARKE